MRLVNLKFFVYPYEANILKARLDAEGIYSFVFDDYEGANRDVNGTIPLKVDEKDLLKAQEILNSIDNSKAIDDDGNEVVCPKCGSTSFYHNFVSLFHNAVYRCQGCEFEIIRDC